MKPPDEIIVHALRSVNGEITSNMRMVAFGYNGNGATFRFYVTEEPSEADRAHAEVVALNFDSGHAPQLEQMDLEFVVTSEPLGKLDPLGFSIFRRAED